MDTDKLHTCDFKPEVGRGCAFCNCGQEPEAIPCEGCFKLHETPWLETYPANVPTDIVEVRFKNTRRGFYQNANDLPLKIGDIVAVEASPGHDIGIVSLTGDLVARQMRRTGFNPFNGEYKKVYRKAKPYDIERWQEAISMEHETMIASRQIAADMGLNMKIGDVEYQGDKMKAIFYYIADERVDFRELIKVFAERFHIRIEMKQIGARQEAGRIGGLGACGRELCCASWISSFTSVTTGAARAQEISLNPQKLAGQCSKLKCCMMYEYDTYVDARKEFPRLREPLQTVDGEWFPVKNDILAGTMTFSSSKEAMANVTTLPISRVREIMALNRQGRKADRLCDIEQTNPAAEEPTYRSEEDSITRFDQSKRRKRGGRNRSRGDKPADGETPVSRSEAGPHTDAEQRRQRRERPHTDNRSETKPANGETREQRDHGFRTADGNGNRQKGPRGEQPDSSRTEPADKKSRPQNGGNGRRNADRRFGTERSERRTTEESGRQGEETHPAEDRENGRNRSNRNRRRGNGNGDPHANSDARGNDRESDNNAPARKDGGEESTKKTEHNR